jgi:hypothetical protein
MLAAQGKPQAVDGRSVHFGNSVSVHQDQVEQVTRRSLGVAVKSADRMDCAFLRESEGLPARPTGKSQETNMPGPLAIGAGLLLRAAAKKVLPHATRAAARVVANPPGRLVPPGAVGDLARRGYNNARDAFDNRRR